MTDQRRRPGRPRKLPAPLFLASPPAWTKGVGPSRWHQEMLASMDNVEQDLVRAYRYSPLVSRRHAIDLALVQELGAAERRRVAAADADLRERARRYAREGGNTASRPRMHDRARRVDVIVAKNKDLLARVRPFGALSVSRVAEIIFRNWADRGDDRPRPALRTLRDWIDRALRLARSSLPQK